MGWKPGNGANTVEVHSQPVAIIPSIPDRHPSRGAIALQSEESFPPTGRKHLPHGSPEQAHQAEVEALRTWNDNSTHCPGESRTQGAKYHSTSAVSNPPAPRASGPDSRLRSEFRNCPLVTLCLSIANSGTATMGFFKFVIPAEKTPESRRRPKLPSARIKRSGCRRSSWDR